MFSLEYELSTIKYRIIKSNRKTTTISILPTKEVIVKAPIYLSDKEIKNMVKQKAKWIISKLGEIPEDFISKQERKYQDGERFLYRGKEYKLKIIEDSKIENIQVQLKQNEIVILMNKIKIQVIPSLLELWYKEKARELVYERIKYYSPFINRKIQNVRIKNQKKRWGSCSSLGNLNFNWRIIMMPDDMFDYIIVHEMCHLKHLNHSKDYWNCVGEILPDYKEREKWIKKNGMNIEL
ncbi:MAG: M48 family metallopeptidase [Lachnotalea sp.]